MSEEISSDRWKSAAIFALIAIVVLLLATGKHYKSLNEENLKASQDTIESYKDKYGRIVSEKRSYVLENTKILKKNDSLKSVIKNFKPIVITKWKVVYKPSDTIRITYEKEVPFKFTRQWEFKDKWFGISGISNNKGVTVEDYSFLNEVNLAVGYKSDHWYSPNYASVKIVNSNPRARVVAMDNFIIKPKKKIFERSWFLIGLGALGGFVLSR